MEATRRSAHLSNSQELSPSSASRFVLTLWTDDLALARRADAAGVDRIGLDLEALGKAERQPKRFATWISPHRADQLPALRAALRTAKLFCRINPLHSGSADEIELLLGYGVQVIMLPMFTTAQEVERFVTLVGARATCVLLLENTTAADRIEEIVRVPGVSDLHVGLNDLTLSLGTPNANRFELLGSDLLKRVAATVLDAGVRFGVGGIGRAMQNDLPIPADLIYAQHARLGATAALIARSFLIPSSGAPPVDLAAEVQRARERLAWWGLQSAETLENARQQLLDQTRAATW
jgi:hypothetical protein